MPIRQLIDHHNPIPENALESGHDDRRVIWIAFSLVSLHAVFAQQNPTIHVTVQVTDVTGAGVPRAAIEMAPSPKSQILTFETDGSGKAEFELPPGNYDLHVKSQGFCPFRRFLEPLNEQNQVVTTKLQIDYCPGPCQMTCVYVYPEPGPQPEQAHEGLLKVIVTDASGVVVLRANLAGYIYVACQVRPAMVR